MSFFTVPDRANTPNMINSDHVETITLDAEDASSVITLTSGKTINTFMPRNILVNMINKQQAKPVPVQPTTEFAG